MRTIEKAGAGRTGSGKKKWRKHPLLAFFITSRSSRARFFDLSHWLRAWNRLAFSWLDSSVGRALHRYRRGHGFESRSGLNVYLQSNQRHTHQSEIRRGFREKQCKLKVQVSVEERQCLEDLNKLKLPFLQSKGLPHLPFGSIRVDLYNITTMLGLFSDRSDYCRLNDHRTWETEVSFTSLQRYFVRKYFFKAAEIKTGSARKTRA